MFQIKIEGNKCRELFNLNYCILVNIQEKTAWYSNFGCETQNSRLYETYKNNPVLFEWEE